MKKKGRKKHKGTEISTGPTTSSRHSKKHYNQRFLHVNDINCIHMLLSQVMAYRHIKQLSQRKAIYRIFGVFHFCDKYNFTGVRHL